MKRLCWLILTFIFARKAEAVEYQPWLGNPYEFETRFSAYYQGYQTVSSGSYFEKYSSNDLFLNFSLRNANPDPPFGLEFEIMQAKTRKQHGQIDQLKLNGTYVWYDDVAGDQVSLITGVSYAQAFNYSLEDVSAFHHGLYNGEFFLTVGKEYPYEEYWWGRWWGLVAVGIAEQGAPWCRFNLDFEKRATGSNWQRHEFGLFIHSLWGFGKKELHLHHFRGYGAVQHHSIDVGLRYTFLLDYFGSASLEYSYRVYALNFPVQTQQVLLLVLYTFGL